MKLLIDTNVIIGLEDAKAIQEHFATLHRKCGEHGIGVFVHEASKEDIARDKDTARRAMTLSKIKKFQILKKSGTPSDSDLAHVYGPFNRANDLVDAKL